MDWHLARDSPETYHGAGDCAQWTAAQVGEDDGEPGGPEEEEAGLLGQGVTEEPQGQTAVTDGVGVGADVTDGE